MHWFQYWPLDHLQMFSNWSPGFVTGIATLSWIVLLVLLVGIELVSSSTRVTSVKSATRCWREKVRDNRTHRSDQGYLGPIKKSSFAKENEVVLPKKKKKFGQEWKKRDRQARGRARLRRRRASGD